METSSNVNVPARSSDRSMQSLPSSFLDRIFEMSLSPASLQSFSSDTSDANDLDELDEHDIWEMDISANPYGDGSRAQQQAPLPPRTASTNRRLPVASDSRSPSRDGNPSWMAPSVNSLSSITTNPPGSSPLGSGGRNAATRILSSEASARRAPVASRMIPRMSQHGETSSFNARASAMPQSAPLRIPHWSNLEGRHGHSRLRTSHDDDETGDTDAEWLPPHELVAREYAISQQTSFSVLEGAGRTLKGRDLSRVRNAVLTYTGFVE